MIITRHYYISSKIDVYFNRTCSGTIVLLQITCPNKLNGNMVLIKYVGVPKLGLESCPKLFNSSRLLVIASSNVIAAKLRISLANTFLINCLPGLYKFIDIWTLTCEFIVKKSRYGIEEFRYVPVIVRSARFALKKNEFNRWIVDGTHLVESVSPVCNKLALNYNSNAVEAKFIPLKMDIIRLYILTEETRYYAKY